MTKIDPVCGMTVDPQNAAGHFEYKGETYYFCSTHCLHKFRQQPESFLNKPSSPTVQLTRRHEKGIAEPGLKATIEPRPKDKLEYTCPMHPEVIRDAPGFCPICGMALEPRTATLEDDNSELIDMKRRLWISAALSLPLFLLSMSEMLP
ncbi:MAG TPA: YHS domain-containing protein, partial [Pyrinomonadaceae bacterium]